MTCEKCNKKFKNNKSYKSHTKRKTDCSEDKNRKLLKEQALICGKSSASDKCEFKDCSKFPIFGFKNNKRRFCKEHKLLGMVDVKHKLCNEENCLIRASYGYDKNKPIFCKNHSKDDMYDITNKLCEEKGCKIRAIFGLIDDKPKYCMEHKKENMINLKDKKCEYNDCLITPLFGYEGGKPKFCKKHKEEGMISLNKRTCNFPECNKNPIFGYLGEKYLFCLEHKCEDMIDIVNKKCKECDKQPIFGYKGEIPLYCTKHKKEKMVDLKHKICNFQNCNSVAWYNFENEKHGIFCAKHKDDKMINLSLKYCCINNCYDKVLYGIPGKKRTHCFKHKEKGMIKYSNSKCKECKNNAIFGKAYPIHCELHKLEEEINFIEKECISCGLVMILNEENKCIYCSPKKQSKCYLEKQNKLMHYLDSVNLKGESTDKMIDKGICGRERPDRVYDLGDKILILECDENQHFDRNCICEQTRMINIGQIFGGIPIYFIRWNPDEYIPKNKSANMENIKKRYELLSEFIKSIIENKVKLPDALVSSFYMYYDDWENILENEWEIFMTYEKN